MNTRTAEAARIPSPVAALPGQSAGGPEPLVFTTQPIAAPHRLDAWNAAFGSLNEIAVAEAAPGIMRSANWNFGGMVLSTTAVPASRFVRDAARARRDSLDHWALRVLRRGRSRLQHPGFVATLGAGQPLLFSMHETWAVEWDEAEWVTLCIPRDLHPELAAQLAPLASGPLRGGCAGLLADMLLALPGRVAAAPATELPALAEATCAMVAACLFHGAPRATGAAAGPTASQKERVRRAIRDHIGSTRLTPGRLAAAAGLSRSALYRLFAAEGGVARYVRDVRLSLAHAALRDPAQAERSIAELAEAHGFPDPSAFSRSFRRTYGITPGAVRTGGLPGPAPARLIRSPRMDGVPGDLVARIYTGRA